MGGRKVVYNLILIHPDWIAQLQSICRHLYLVADDLTWREARGDVVSLELHCVEGV